MDLLAAHHARQRTPLPWKGQEGPPLKRGKGRREVGGSQNISSWEISTAVKEGRGAPLLGQVMASSASTHPAPRTTHAALLRRVPAPKCPPEVPKSQGIVEIVPRRTEGWDFDYWNFELVEVPCASARRVPASSS